MWPIGLGHGLSYDSRNQLSVRVHGKAFAYGLRINRSRHEQPRQRCPNHLPTDESARHRDEFFRGLNVIDGRLIDDSWTPGDSATLLQRNRLLGQRGHWVSRSRSILDEPGELIDHLGDDQPFQFKTEATELGNREATIRPRTWSRRQRPGAGIIGTESTVIARPGLLSRGLPPAGVVSICHAASLQESAQGWRQLSTGVSQVPESGGVLRRTWSIRVATTGADAT